MSCNKRFLKKFNMAMITSFKLQLKKNLLSELALIPLSINYVLTIANMVNLDLMIRGTPSIILLITLVEM